MAKRVKVLEFQLKSTDPDRETIEAVRETVKLSDELQASVEKKYPGVKVKIKRAEGVPVHELVHHILVSIDWRAVASGAEKAIGQFAATKFLELATKRIRNIFANPATPPELPAGPAAPKTPETKQAKKSSAAKKATIAKKAVPTKKVVPKKGTAARKSTPRNSSAKSK